MSKELTKEEKDYIICLIWEVNEFDCNHDISTLMDHTWDEFQGNPKLHRYPFPFEISSYNDYVIDDFKRCQSITRKLQEDE